MPKVETTEIETLEADELHMVKRGANGFPPLLAKAAAEEVANVLKATLSAKDRDAMDDSEFAYVDSKGEKHLPIGDESHVRSALGRFDQTEFENAKAKKTAAKKILAAAKKFDINTADDGDVAQAAKSVQKAAAEDEEPGSPDWEHDDAQTMADAAEMLLQAADKVKAFCAREAAELQVPVEAGMDMVGDYTQIWDAQDALGLITAALGVVARLGAQEAHEAMPDGAEKAGKVLSDKNVKAIRVAMSTLKQLLASAGAPEEGGEAAKAGEENHDMTKEELFAWLDERDATKAAASETEAAAKAAAETGAETTADDANKPAVITPELLTEAVAKGVQVALSPLQERLETVEKMAAPGGPVKTRPQETLTKAAERDTLELQAAEYERRARGLNSDPELRKAYEGKAAETRTAIAALVG